MDNVLHILSGDSAAGCLKHGLESHCITGHEIHVVRDDLSVGPLQGIEERASFLVNELLGASAEAELRDYLSAGPASWPPHGGFSGRKVVVWHSPNVIEQMMLRMVVSRLSECDLLEIEPHRQGSDRRATAEHSPGELAAIVDAGTRLSAGRIAALQEDWERLRRAPEPLRILQAERIVPVALSYYDSQILAGCSDTPRPAMRVVGEVLGTSKQLVTDTFISCRLRQLIEDGRVEAIKSGSSLRDFTVKLPASK
jgi:hypothetical protein